MRVAVLGASGIVAGVVLADLLDAGSVEELILADIHPAAAEQRLAALRPPRGRVSRVEAGDPASVAAAVRGAEMVLNCAQYTHNLSVMRGALAAGAHYLDLGGLYHVTGQQLELHQEFAAGGLTAILGIGSAPGITNVMTMAAARTLDRVTAVRIRAASAVGTGAAGLPPLAVPYSLATILDELTLAPVVLRQGQPAEVAPRSDPEVAQFPDLNATCTMVCTLHSELATLPRTLRPWGIEEMDFKVGFPTALMRDLEVVLALGLGSAEPITLGDRPVPRRSVLQTLLQQRLPGNAAGQPVPPEQRGGSFWVEVDGTRSGRPVQVRVESPYRGGPRAEVPGYATGVPMSIAARMLASGQITARGVLAPEICIDPDPFFAELGRRGIAMYWTEQERIA